MSGLNAEPFVPIGLVALTEPPGPGPTAPVLHDMPLFEPGCPVPLIVDGWGSAASATLAEASRRQVIMLRDVTMRFMSKPFLKAILHIGGCFGVRSVRAWASTGG